MEDKKVNNVGIITYHRPINYGAILQVYALQKKIKEFNVKCDVIDYRNITLESLHRKKKLSEAKNLKQFVRDVLLLKNHNLKFDKFREFSEKHLIFSRPLHDFDGMVSISNNYDKFVVGSDQVWNYKINKMDPVYFLKFVNDNSKKVTYAVSFGVNDIPEIYKKKYIDFLKDFNNILIREKKGREIINNLISKESNIVLDPTLLVSKEEWYEIATEKKHLKDKYILVYAFSGSKYIMDLAKNISKKTGYKIIWICNSYKKSFNIKYIKSAGPDEFLGLFKNAEYIITNSFHGTIFSINFNKHFFTELLPETKGTNSRMVDVLELFNLSDRIINDSEITNIELKIDYKKVNEILKYERNRSLMLLKQACELDN